MGGGLDLVYGFLELKRTYQDETRSLTIPGGIRYQSDSAYYMVGKMKVDSYAPERSFGSRVSRYMIWPDKHIAGISYRTERFIIDFNIKYIPWSESSNSGKFRLEDVRVRTPIGLETNAFQFNLNWKNQTIFAVGAEYKWNDSTFHIACEY
ncbi:hypothetical protein ACO2KH_05315 [Leptospira terpstrae]|uniref:hypothetical protein n=1 Tax=Leptospira terpstrae TaxID=293075 RepID=UPI003CFE5229